MAVVVCTRDRPGPLERSLESVAREVGHGDELIVVDSASRDPAVQRIAAAAGAAVLRCDLPGLSRARNAGVEAAGAPIVAFTDDDCEVQPGWRRLLTAPFADVEIGFATGGVVAGDAAGGAVTVLTDRRPRRFGGEVDPMIIGHGANMAFRRLTLAAIGGFDEALGAGAVFRAGEDHDAFVRALARGWHGVFAPDALVVHHQRLTRRQAVLLSYGYGLGGGAMAAKTMRGDRSAGGRLLVRRLWDNGILQAARDLLGGNETGAAASAVKTVGVVAGLARGATVPVVGGRYRL